LSGRGDTIINKDFRHDLIKNTPEIFFRFVKTVKQNEEAPPIFNVDGINFLNMKKTGLYLVGTTRFNISPSQGIELLNRIGIMIKDLCGVLNEESVKKNFVLIYEILDEVVDFGYPQSVTVD
jgi:AP-4 complex subunit mu-1